MDRNEAVNCLREITTVCTRMSPDFVSLYKSKQDDPLSLGYQIHIKAVLDKEAEKQIRTIAKKRGLAVEQVNGKVII